MDGIGIGIGMDVRVSGRLPPPVGMTSVRRDALDECGFLDEAGVVDDGTAFVNVLFCMRARCSRCRWRWKWRRWWCLSWLW